jgi:hypothetical protein
MPDISFPSNPSVNDTYSFGGKTWIWTGSYWALNTAGSINGINIGNITPATGAFTTLTSSGNTTLGNIAGNVLPAANVTYDLGSTSQRWNDLWLANSTIHIGEANISSSGATLDLPSDVALGAVSMSTSTGSLALPVGTTVGGSLVETPKIANLQITNSSWTVLDDTAISLDGGYFIVNGSGFQSGATVIVNNTAASAVTFVSSTVLRCQVGAASAGSYIVYVSNPDGGTALKPAGLTYSATPTWVTGSTLADAQSGQAYTANLSASGATSYALAAGNSLPTGMSLAGNGQISGTTTVESNTTYNFTINAIDAELQDSPRAFSLTVSVEPALGSFYNGGYYAGRIAIDGNLYRIIVAPKATGQDYRQIASSGNAPSVTTEQTRYDGWTTTNAMINAGGWPAASWARGLTINGYNDWYLPSTWEMCLCFATFKPTTTNNDTSMGSNAYTRTPGWPANTAFQSQTPARTTDALFQLPSGAQAFNKGYATNSNLYYITYSANSGGSAYTVSFDSDDGAAGRGLTNNGYWSVSKTEYLLVRVIRRELIGPA